MINIHKNEWKNSNENEIIGYFKFATTHLELKT